jgi:UPF0755 protein
MGIKLARNLIACIFILAAITLTAISYLHLYVNKPGPLTSNKILLLGKGTSLTKFSKRLATENIIAQPKLFLITLKAVKFFYNIKAGEYAFPVAITPKQIIDMLINGRSVIHRITIPEGLTVKQVIDKLNTEPVLVGEITSTITEGYLLPDTYFFSYGDKRQMLIDRMHKKLLQALDELWETRTKDLPIKTKEEALILASIIEKETALSSERTHVSSVFINRLRKGMKLQADPTTIYAITNGQTTLGRELSKKDLLIESPFNTYFTTGLPPHPIANPGRAAIEAALNPAKTNDLFFVVSGAGGHRFSDSLQQHNINVHDWRTKNTPKKP